MGVKLSNRQGNLNLFQADGKPFLEKVFGTRKAPKSKLQPSEKHQTSNSNRPSQASLAWSSSASTIPRRSLEFGDSLGLDAWSLVVRSGVLKGFLYTFAHDSPG